MSELDRTVAPPVAEVESLHLPAMESIVLPGGTTLKIYRGGDMPVNALFAVRRGGLAETGGPAAAGLYARLVNEGSALYTGEEFAELMDFNGSWMNANTNAHHMVQKFFSLNSRFGEVLPAIADAVLHPAFPERALEAHAHSLARRTEVNRTKVKYLAQELANDYAMGSDHPLAARLEPADALAVSRQGLTDMFRRFSNPASLTVYLAGDITPDIRAAVERAFSAPDVAPAPCELNVEPFRPSGIGQTVTMNHADARQSAVVMTLPAIQRSHPDYVALHLTVMALGGYFGSRLMQNIREEKGLTYGISAGLSGYIDGSIVSIATECDNRFAAQVIDEVRAEVRRLVTDPPRGEELTRLKQSASASQLEVLDSPINIASFHAIMECSGIPSGYFDAKQKAIAALTPEEISHTAATYLNPDAFTITAVGDTSVMKI